MGFFKKLTKTVVDTALLPVEVVRDATTLGGVLTDQKEPYTKKRGEKVIEDIESLYEWLEED